MKAMWRYLIENLITATSGGWSAKIMALMQLSIIPALGFSITESLTGWYLQNWVFLSFVFFSLMIDHLIGSYVHWLIKDDWSWKKNLHGLLNKGFSVIAGYVLLEMMHQIMQDVDFIAIYIKVSIQLMVFLYPTSSALANISIMTKGKFPPSGWMDKIKKFNEDVKLSNFKTKEDETDNSYDDYPNDDVGMSGDEEKQDRI